GLKSLFQHKNKRPEQVGAFGLRPVSVFSHSLQMGAFFIVNINPMWEGLAPDIGGELQKC
ncbi:hypothetical protein ACIQRH_22825, partial [Pseudomonas sp. NPDC090964]|uniref:hypothetical protein n=1 Tax=Pseudomonas sp. NPDC090964 TaxID=3364482 RepID=UPI00380A77EE